MKRHRAICTTCITHNRYTEALFKEATALWQSERDHLLSPGQLMAAFFGLPNPNRRTSMDASPFPLQCALLCCKDRYAPL